VSAAFEDLRERTLVMELLERSGLTDRLEARTDGVSHLERMASILVNPQLYDSNDLFPKRPPKSGGAARHFANAPWIYVYYGALIHLSVRPTRSTTR